MDNDTCDGFSMRFDREEWGVIIDALIQHRSHADSRKTANSESTSDIRADMCADLIRRVSSAASCERRAFIMADVDALDAPPKDEP